MIREFWAENFMSIKDKQTLSFEATKDDTAVELLTREVRSNVRLNKLVILYGANASGKTNMLYAIYAVFARLLITESNRGKVSGFKPFALNKNKPTKLFVSFYIDATRYDYFVEYDVDKIISEKLEYAPNGVLSLFYLRTYVSEDLPPAIEFGRTLGLFAKTKYVFIANTLNNHSVLSTYDKVSVGEDAAQIKLLFYWISKNMHDIDGDYSHNYVKIVRKATKDDSRRSFIQDFLKKADFNISKFAIEKFKRELPDDFRERIANDEKLSDSVKKSLLGDKYDVVFTHRSSDGEFSLTSDEQSSGTLEYLKLLNYLYDMVSGNHIYLFDEMERGLHYDLLIHFLTTFMMNTDRSQLIITTQDQLLLSEEFIRRDMVWFVEKSKENSATELYRASNYGIHKNASLYNAYRIGKLGAKPELGSVFVDENCCD